jgi:hypothetical protein
MLQYNLHSLRDSVDSLWNSAVKCGNALMIKCFNTTSTLGKAQWILCGTLWQKCGNALMIKCFNTTSTLCETLW